MKKGVNWFHAIAIALVCLPVLSYSIAKNWLSENDENRVLAERPVLSIENIQEYPAEFETYFNDHLPYKNELVKIYSYINTVLLKSSSNPSVILGKDNWLFYDSKNSGDADTLADYMGTNLYSDKELEDAVQNVISMYENVTSRGIEFYLFIAPNKSTIYSEYMPDYYEKGNISKVEQLIKALEEYPQINVVYAKDILEEYKDDYQLYYKYDTHWNHIGGYFGTQALLEKMGKEVTPISEVTINQELRKKSYDLAYMLNLLEYYNDDYWYSIENYNLELKVEERITDQISSGIYNSIYETNHEDQRTLLVCRDSFGGATCDTLPKNFGKTVYVYRDLWKDEYLETYEPDIFVFEVVERYISVLPSFLQSRIE